MQLFPDWYVTKHLKATLTEAQQQVMNKTFAMLNASILTQPKVYVHRDYHSRNLMVQENSHDLGVLDFQDAVYGPITYDLVSLLKDAYISWEEDQVLDWTVRYWQSARQAGLPMSEDFAEFYREVIVTGKPNRMRSEEHTSELQSLMRISYAVFCL